MRKHAFAILRVLVAAGAIWLVFKGENLKELANVLLDIDLWIFAAALALYLLGQAFFVLRWRSLLKVQSVDISFLVGLKLHFLGLFYNNCLPSSVGGDFLRAWYVTKHAPQGKALQAALSVFVDRLVGLTGMFLMAGLSLWLMPVDGNGDKQQIQISFNIFDRIAQYKWLFLGIFCGIIALLAAASLWQRTRTALTALLKKAMVLITHLVEKTILAFKLYLKSPLVLIKALFYTFLCQGVCIIGFWLLGRNLGITTPMKYYFVFFPVSWFIGALPISLGGLGIMEGGLKMMFAKTGTATEQALAIAVCQRLVWFFGSIGGVIVHISGWHLPVDKEEFFVDSEQVID